jgi:hypothetical protein
MTLVQIKSLKVLNRKSGGSVKTHLIEMVPMPGHMPNSELVCDGYGLPKNATDT